MIPIVEDYLSELIQSKLAYLKSNPNAIDTILATSQDKLNSLKTFIQTKPIQVTLGYPRTPAELPAYCLLLSSEEETQNGLGDYGDSIDTNYGEQTDGLSVIDTINAPYPFPYVVTSITPISEVSSLIHNDTGMAIDYEVYDPDLGIIKLDSIAENGDSVTISYTYLSTSQEQMSVMYEANYRIESWADNGDLVVQMYHLLKWMLLSGRDDLVSNDLLYRQRLSGADFEPAPQFFPAFIYRRALNFWCQFDASTPDDQVQYISSITTNQTEYVEPFIGGEE